MKKILKNVLIGATLLLTMQSSSCEWDDDEVVEPEEIVIDHFLVGIWDLTREQMVEAHGPYTYDKDLETDFFIEFCRNGEFRTYKSYSMDDYYGLVTLTRPNERGFWEVDDYDRNLTLFYDDGVERNWHFDHRSHEVLELRSYDVDTYGHPFDIQTFEKIYMDRDSIHFVH